MYQVYASDAFTASVAMPVPQVGHCAASVAANLMILAGGETNSNQLYTFDPLADVGGWSKAYEMPVGRQYASCGVATHPDSGLVDVVIVGGESRAASIFNVETHGFTAASDLPYQLAWPAVVQVQYN